MHISHEALYQNLYIQARGTLKNELTKHLRRARKYRNCKRGRGAQGRLLNMVPLAHRPPEADDRKVPGHWEGDLIAGTHGSYLITLVERASRFVLLGRVPNRKSLPVTEKLAERMQGLPDALKRSVAWDRGKAMAEHQRITLATDIQVYFCDPYSPWQRGGQRGGQRGSNENTNGLLRQYFP